MTTPAEPVSFTRNLTVMRGGRRVGRIEDRGFRHGAQVRWRLVLEAASGIPGVHSDHPRLRAAKAAAMTVMQEGRA